MAAPRVPGHPDRRDVLFGALLAAAGLAEIGLRPVSTAPQLSARWVDAAVPRDVGPWRVAAVDGVVTAPEDELAARLYDQVLTRIYRAPGARGQLPDIALLVASGRGQDLDVQLHRPDACYPAQGYVLSAERAVRLGFAGRALTASSVAARRDDDVQQVLWWTRIGDIFPGDAAAQNRAIVHANLAGRAPDAVLVRLSVGAADDGARAAAAALGVLVQFAGALGAALGPAGRKLLVEGFGNTGHGAARFAPNGNRT